LQPSKPTDGFRRAQAVHMDTVQFSHGEKLNQDEGKLQ
jgi:hypothetical protein